MTLYILNLFDLATTLCAMSKGAVEMNPIIEFVVGIHPAIFPVVKLIPAYFLCRWLERNSRKSYAVVCAVYAAMVANNIAVLHMLG